jgi:hypothetical protein
MKVIDLERGIFLCNCGRMCFSKEGFANHLEFRECNAWDDTIKEYYKHKIIHKIFSENIGTYDENTDALLSIGDFEVIGKFYPYKIFLYLFFWLNYKTPNKHLGMTIYAHDIILN